MPITVWKDLFAKIRDTVDATGGRQIQTLVWHGGEPTLLLESYVNRVLDLQSQMIGDLVADRLVQNAVQTNLYSWTKSLKRMIDEGFHFSVSCDFSPGGRETMGCLDAEKRVWQNLESLLAFDIEVGVLLVLARHNHRHLVDAHDSMEALGVKWLRIVTAFDPMNTAPVGRSYSRPGRGRRQPARALEPPRETALADDRGTTGRPVRHSFTAYLRYPAVPTLPDPHSRSTGWGF